MPSPTFVAEYETVWNTATSPKTASVTVGATTDVLVVCAITGDSSGTLATPTGGTGVSWTLQKSDTTVSFCDVYLWTATGIAPQTFTLSVAQTGTSLNYGFNCLRFSSAAVGASSKANNPSGAPTLNLTTTAANSAIVVMNGDWNAVNGSSRTWLTNAGSLTEQTYNFVSGGYTAYAGYHANAGTIGTYAVGLSAPSGQTYNIIACEIQGLAATGATTAWFTA